MASKGGGRPRREKKDSEIGDALKAITAGVKTKRSKAAGGIGTTEERAADAKAFDAFEQAAQQGQLGEVKKIAAEQTRNQFDQSLQQTPGITEGEALQREKEFAVSQGEGQVVEGGGSSVSQIGNAAGALIGALVPRGADGNPGLDFTGDPDKKNFMSNLLTNIILFTEQGRGIAQGQLNLAKARSEGGFDFTKGSQLAAFRNEPFGGLSAEENKRILLGIVRSQKKKLEREKKLEETS